MKFGILAQQQGFELELQILKSQRGFYIGTATSEGLRVGKVSIASRYNYENNTNISSISPCSGEGLIWQQN
ncbi:TPA: hypothetical protein JEL88_004506 [Salmonella enterica subsp. enterica serovar Liverpool]|nr:hypothetical protein [Salmonella enterica subsp. enterica serovar Liverpool]